MKPRNKEKKKTNEINEWNAVINGNISIYGVITNLVLMKLNDFFTPVFGSEFWNKCI